MAKSRDHDLGNKHNWAHSSYYMRQWYGLGERGRMQLMYRVCKCRCRSRSKINGLMKKDWHLQYLNHLCSPDLLPLCSPNPSPAPSTDSLYLALLRLPLPQNCLVFPQDLRLPWILFRVRNCAECAFIRCWAEISLSLTSPQPNRMVDRFGLIMVLWGLLVGCYRSIAVGLFLLVAADWSLCGGRFMSVALCRSFYVGCFVSVIVGRMLWDGEWESVVVYLSVLIDRFVSVGSMPDG